MNRRVAVHIRDKIVPLAFVVSANEYDDFLSAFDAYSVKDAYVAKKRKDHYILFEYCDSEFGKVEVPIGCHPLPANIICVRFSPIESPQKVRYFSTCGP